MCRGGGGEVRKPMNRVISCKKGKTYFGGWGVLIRRGPGVEDFFTEGSGSQSTKVSIMYRLQAQSRVNFRG